MIMGNKIYINGKRVFKLPKESKFYLNINGKNNKIKLNDFNGNGNVYINLTGENCTFSFGKYNVVNNDLVFNYLATCTSNLINSKICIGDNNLFNGTNNLFIAPINTKIVIGNGNMFAGNITFWGRNDHIIYDLNTKKRLNVDEDIIIGDNNWICQNVSFLPGGQIDNNNVVGYGSLVNRKLRTSNSLIAGVPIEIKRENINWSRAANYENIDFENCLNVKER